MIYESVVEETRRVFQEVEVAPDVARIGPTTGSDGITIRHTVSEAEEMADAIRDVLALTQALYDDANEFAAPERLEGRLRVLEADETVSYHAEGEWFQAAATGEIDAEEVLGRVAKTSPALR
jgi:hypothetical protein